MCDSTAAHYHRGMPAAEARRGSADSQPDSADDGPSTSKPASRKRKAASRANGHDDPPQATGGKGGKMKKSGKKADAEVDATEQVGADVASSSRLVLTNADKIGYQRVRPDISHASLLLPTASASCAKRLCCRTCMIGCAAANVLSARIEPIREPLHVSSDCSGACSCLSKCRPASKGHST